MKYFNLKEYLNIFNHVRPNKFVYFFILACDCLTEISFYLLTPIVMKLMIDAAVKSDMNLLTNGLYLTLAVSVSGMVLFVTLEFFLFGSFSKTAANVKLKLFKTILHLPVSYIEQNHSGDTISRLTNDADAMEEAYSWPLRMVLVTLASGLGSALAMFILDWKVSVILIAVGLFSVLINLKQAKLFREINDKIQASLGKYTENLSNILGGFMTIKTLGLEKKLLENAEEINGSIFNGNVAITKKSAFIEARNFFFSSLNSIGVIVLASFLAMNGISSLGSVVSMILFLGHVNRMFGSINGMILQLQGYLAASGRVVGLMGTDVEPETVYAEAVNGSNAAIAMKDVVFSYDGENSVLNGINLTLEKGQIAALVGPSGGGKSTVIKLLMGFYTPASGQMTIGGKPLRSMSMSELRAMIAYVPQDSYIFDGTVEENIRYGKIDATAQEIISAAKASHADEFIRELENGYDTLVGERGVKLSGGQRQRIAIARAFLKDAPILLLDEATSSLDSQSEQYVQEALNTLMKNRTTLIIAHRLSTIEHAHIIYLVENGKIIENGTHSTLVSNGGLYQKLYMLQFNTNALRENELTG